MAVVTLPGLLLIGEVVRVAIAENLGQSANIADVSKAARLDTLNPEFENRLGLLYEFDWQDTDLAKAIFHLKRATTLQPQKAEYWANLGGACSSFGDEMCAGVSYENAASLAPAIPHYQWEIANYCLLTGRREESLRHYREFLKLSPENSTLVFRACLKAFDDPRLIWRVFLGTSDEVKLAYVYSLSTNGHPDDAYRFWNEMLGSSSKVSFGGANPYLEQLIESGDTTRGFKVWQDLEKAGAIHEPEKRDPEGHDSTNRIFNGGFEQTPLNAGFDWRRQPQQYVESDFADKDSYEGSRCLRVDFSVAHNAEDEPVYEIVPVEPNQQYVFVAHVRSADITSDSGPRLRILDPRCPGCLSTASEQTVGSTPWHEVSLRFFTAPRTQAIRISVWRSRSRSFPMEIQGCFWVDSVSLRAVNAPSHQGGSQ